MADTQYKLIIGNYIYSSWSMRGALAVDHSGLSHDRKVISLFTDTGTKELAQLSPSALVPTLLVEESGKRWSVWDSLAILEYVAALTPEKYWWPDTPGALAVSRSMVAEMHSGFTALRTACPMNLHASYSGLKIMPKLQADLDKLERRWADARQQYGADGPFLFGQWSAADIVFAPVVTRLKTYGITLNETCQAYCAAVLEHPHMRDWYAKAEAENTRIDKYDHAVIEDGWLGAML